MILDETNIWTGKEVLCIKTGKTGHPIKGNFHLIVNFTKDFKYFKLEINGITRMYIREDTEHVQDYELFEEYFVPKDIHDIRLDKIEAILKI